MEWHHWLCKNLYQIKSWKNAEIIIILYTLLSKKTTMNKKLLLLLWGYTAGIVAALLYNKKNPSEITSELQTAQDAWQDKTKVFFDNFIEIHKNLLESLKTNIFTQENKVLFEKKKEEFLQIADDYSKKAEGVFEEYRQKWKNYTQEGIEKLEIFYTDALEKLDDIKDKTPERIEQVKKKLTSYFEEIRSKLKKIS